MKNKFILLGIWAIGFANAQDDPEYYGRVGINTTRPNASLEIRKHTGIPTDKAQGVLFPKFTTQERTMFTNIQEGTLIYNMDKKCIEIYLGVVSGVNQWDCLPNASSSQQQNISITPFGFEGGYFAGTALTTANKVKFKIANNSFSTIGPLDLSSVVSITNGIAGIKATGLNNNSITLVSGAEQVLEYTLSGTPENGTLTADFFSLGLSATQSIPVGMVRATIQDKKEYIVSLTHNGQHYQGKINNDTEKLKIKIPYTDGLGSYSGFTSIGIVNNVGTGESGDTNTFTLTIPAGNYSINGEIDAEVTVSGSDTEFLAKKLAPAEQEKIVTFPVMMNGISFNVELWIFGGVPDKYYGDGKHNFVYVPVEVTGLNGYKKTWLNNNLGAEYSRLGSNYFDIFKQSQSIDDWKAYGSLFQWQRPADGHELVTWNKDNISQSILTTIVSTPLGNSEWRATHSNFVLGNSTTNYSWIDAFSDISSLNKDLWQKDGLNNPCPTGYHVPTGTEWQALQNATQGSKNNVWWALNSVLRLPSNGWRSGLNGIIYYYGKYGAYWASNVYTNSRYSYGLYFDSQSTRDTNYSSRAGGFAIRCIKDN